MSGRKMRGPLSRMFGVLKPHVYVDRQMDRRCAGLFQTSYGLCGTALPWASGVAPVETHICDGHLPNLKPLGC